MRRSTLIALGLACFWEIGLGPAPAAVALPESTQRSTVTVGSRPVVIAVHHKHHRRHHHHHRRRHHLAITAYDHVPSVYRLLEPARMHEIEFHRSIHLYPAHDPLHPSHDPSRPSHEMPHASHEPPKK